MNVWSFTGRLGRDAEVRHLPNGDAVASFSVAVDFGYGDKKGTIWPRCAMFGKRAEALSPYLKKGTQVAISGELSEREYKNKDGEEVVSLDLRVNDLTLVGGKPEGQAAAPAPAKPAAKPGKSKMDDFDDDIPF